MMLEWFEKQEQYENRFLTGKITKNLWKYIPKSKYEAVADAFADDEGYWIYLEEGWRAYDGGEDCGVIHEFRIADLKEAINSIRKV